MSVLNSRMLAATRRLGDAQSYALSSRVALDRAGSVSAAMAAALPSEEHRSEMAETINDLFEI
jgi:hypothetical protein